MTTGLRQMGMLLGIPLLVIGALAAVYVLLIEPTLGDPGGDDSARPARRQKPDTSLISTPMFSPGVRNPPHLSANIANVSPDGEVIGISAGSKHRAYCLSVLRNFPRLAVNDVLGEIPITVTYGPYTDCIRVFTSPNQKTALEIGLAGLYKGKLLLRLERQGTNELYDQETGLAFNREGSDLPYPSYPFERTTWRAWLEVHPNTDVYCGD